jgi:hypothetical protein
MQHPGVDVIGRRLTEIRDRADVADVLVDVLVEQEEYPADEWPFAQDVLVVTTASPETVDSWIDGFNADPCGVEGNAAGWVNPPDVPAGYQIVSVWWD